MGLCNIRFERQLSGQRNSDTGSSTVDYYLTITQHFMKYFDVCNDAFDFKMLQNTSTLVALNRFQKTALNLLSCLAPLPCP